ncbi:hypothetical protein OIU79_011738 [Salix purpurea]|uniref:Uncharacterized protein n=1 Tax=Salix purpurea TaxID=77065 RepID=A0A9Q0T278_SALPP|nr:hypothetical protein OIU79_011738 [Salix purpurea]
MSSKFNLSQFPSLDDEDDDFQIPLSQTPKQTLSSRIKPANNPRRPSKKPKKHNNPGKENIDPNSLLPHQKAESIGNGKLDSESGIKEKLEVSGGYLCNSIEARLMKSRVDYCGVNVGSEEDFEENSELDVLIKLCAEQEESEVREENKVNCDGNEFRFVLCPLCGTNISDLSEEFRLVHTNACLDKEENSVQDVVLGGDDGRPAVVPRGLEGPVCGPEKVVCVTSC